MFRKQKKVKKLGMPKIIGGVAEWDFNSWGIDFLFVKRVIINLKTQNSFEMHLGHNQAFAKRDVSQSGMLSVHFPTNSNIFGRYNNTADTIEDQKEQKSRLIKTSYFSKLRYTDGLSKEDLDIDSVLDAPLGFDERTDTWGKSILTEEENIKDYASLLRHEAHHSTAIPIALCRAKYLMPKCGLSPTEIVELSHRKDVWNQDGETQQPVIFTSNGEKNYYVGLNCQELFFWITRSGCNCQMSFTNYNVFLKDVLKRIPKSFFKKNKVIQDLDKWLKNYESLSDAIYEASSDNRGDTLNEDLKKFQKGRYNLSQSPFDQDRLDDIPCYQSLPKLLVNIDADYLTATMPTIYRKPLARKIRLWRKHLLQILLNIQKDGHYHGFKYQFHVRKSKWAYINPEKTLDHFFRYSAKTKTPVVSDCKIVRSCIENAALCVQESLPPTFTAFINLENFCKQYDRFVMTYQDSDFNVNHAYHEEFQDERHAAPQSIPDFTGLADMPENVCRNIPYKNFVKVALYENDKLFQAMLLLFQNHRECSQCLIEMRELSSQLLKVRKQCPRKEPLASYKNYNSVCGKRRRVIEKFKLAFVRWQKKTSKLQTDEID